MGLHGACERANAIVTGGKDDIRLRSFTAEESVIRSVPKRACTLHDSIYAGFHILQPADGVDPCIRALLHGTSPVLAGDGVSTLQPHHKL